MTVCFADPEDEAADVSFRERWEEWHPNVPLVTLRSVHRSIAQPIVKYLCQIEEEDKYHRLVVLIPEVQPKTVLVLPAVQPARRDPGPGDQAGHGQRGALPAPVPAAAVGPQRAVPAAAAPGQPPGSGVLALEDRGADGGGRADGRDGGQERVLGDGGEDLVGNAEQPPER